LVGGGGGGGGSGGGMESVELISYGFFGLDVLCGKPLKKSESR
jgi:hypothetical protein